MPNICVIQFNVSDMDTAIDFYSNKLGFGIKSKEHYPDLVQLEHEGTYTLLCKVDRAAQIDYPNVAQTLVNIQVPSQTSKRPWLTWRPRVWSSSTMNPRPALLESMLPYAIRSATCWSFWSSEAV